MGRVERKQGPVDTADLAAGRPQKSGDVLNVRRPAGDGRLTAFSSEVESTSRKENASV